MTPPRVSPILTTFVLLLRYMKRENEIANMTWKIQPDDLMCPRGRGQMGSRYSLAGGGGGGGFGTRSVTSLDSIGAGDCGLKKQVFMKTFIYKVRSISRVSFEELEMPPLPRASPRPSISFSCIGNGGRGEAHRQGSPLEGHVPQAVARTEAHEGPLLPDGKY